MNKVKNNSSPFPPNFLFCVKCFYFRDFIYSKVGGTLTLQQWGVCAWQERIFQMVKHWIRCCNCIPGVPSFKLTCSKPQLKHFHFWRSFRSLEVVRDHKKVKHWICCCCCIPWIPSFRLICIKPQLEHFHFWRSFRSFEVVRGHQKVKHFFLLLMHSLGSQLSFDLHKAIVKTFSFLEVIQVIRGRQRSLEG